MILVVDMNSKKDSLGFYEFVAPITAIAEELADCVVKHYSELTPQDLSNGNKVILSGSALKDTVTLSQTDRFQWLNDCGKPILGICAGMETIGLVFGSRLVKCSEIGMMQVITLKANPLFSSSFKVYALHNYAIQPSSDFDVLAESAKCVHAIKHKSKEIYGVLFHPEVRNKGIIQQFILAL
jgi:GMP synthase-like glutamine amidotransferase